MINERILCDLHGMAVLIGIIINIAVLKFPAKKDWGKLLLLIREFIIIDLRKKKNAVEKEDGYVIYFNCR